MTRPNVVLIVADDMAFGDIGAFGNQGVTTPALDRLASEGRVLRQQYSASPVCAPARAALLTGRYPARTGVIDTLESRGLDRLALDERTLADGFQRAGYRTGLVGKWHLGALDGRFHPNSRGFDEFFGFRGGWSDFWDYRIERDRTVAFGDGTYLTDALTDAALEFLDRNSREPFFLHLAYNAPHFPLQAPEADLDVFRQTGIYTTAVSTIYAMNRRMDEGIGRILERLESLGIAEDTIVVFLSDNGPDFGGEGDMSAARSNGGMMGHKFLVFEGGIRVPGIVRWPAGLDAGEPIDDMVHFTDWMPTLLAAAGIGARNGERPWDGENVLPVLRGEAHTTERVLYWQWNRYSPVREGNAAIRSSNWKLVRPAIPETMEVTERDQILDDSLKTAEPLLERADLSPLPVPSAFVSRSPLLFDLSVDPGERHDVSAEHPDRIDAMSRLLDEWFEEVETERRRLHSASR